VILTNVRSTSTTKARIASNQAKEVRDTTHSGVPALKDDAGELINECYCEEEGVVVPDVDVDEPADAAGVEEGADDVVDAAAAGAGSFFSSVFAAPVSLPAPDGGLSLSE